MPSRPIQLVRAVLDVDAEGLDQVLRRVGDLGDGRLERLAVPGARLAIAAELADVLAGGGLQFAGRRRFTRTTEGLDAAAHAATVGRMGVLRQPLRLVLVVIAGLAIAVAVDVARVGGPEAWLARHRVPAPYLGGGERVDIGGRSLYLDCRGSAVRRRSCSRRAWATGSPAGTRSSTAWPRRPAPAPTTARVAARAIPAGDTRVADAADDLRTLLEAAGEAATVRGRRALARRGLCARLRRSVPRRRGGPRAGRRLQRRPRDRLRSTRCSATFDAEYERRAQGLRDLVAGVEDLDWPTSEAAAPRQPTSRGSRSSCCALRAASRGSMTRPNEAIATAWESAYGGAVARQRPLRDRLGRGPRHPGRPPGPGHRGGPGAGRRQPRRVTRCPPSPKRGAAERHFTSGRVSCWSSRSSRRLRWSYRATGVRNHLGGHPSMSQAPFSGRRRLATLLTTTGLATLLASGTVLAGTPVTNGYRDHAYGGGAARPNSDKQQSKTWYTPDNQWWAGMFLYTTAAPSPRSENRIWKLSADKSTWTVTPTVVDARDSSHADYYLDSADSTLWVASVSNPNQSNPFAVPTTPDDIRIFRYTLRAAGHTRRWAASTPSPAPPARPRPRSAAAPGLSRSTVTRPGACGSPGRRPARSCTATRTTRARPGRRARSCPSKSTTRSTRAP